MPVYVDTSAWIALHEPRDQNHVAAREHLQRLIKEGVTLISGWHTLVELADGLAHHYNQRAAAGELARLTSSPRLRPVPSEPHLEAAIELLQRRTDWKVDLSDCLSFALMTAAEMDRAFTYDRDFEKAGFHVEG